MSAPANMKLRTMTVLKGLTSLPLSANSLGWGVTLLLFVLILYPLLAVIIQVFWPGVFFGERSFAGFGMLGELFKRPLWTQSLINSLVLATGTACLGTILGGLLAMARTYWSFPTAKLLDVTAWILLITPSFILAQGWVLFANTGGLAAQWLGMDWVPKLIFQPMGLILVMTLSKFSLAYLAMAAAMEWNVTHYGDAARLCGARPFTVWRTVQMPLMLPAFIAGWALVFMDTVGDFGLPSSLATVYRYPTLPYSIYSAIYTSPIRFDMAGVLAFYLVAILAACMAILYWAMSRSRYDFLTGKAAAAKPRKVKFAWALTFLNIGFLLIVLGIPIGSSLLISFMDKIGAGAVWSNLTLAHYKAALQPNSLFMTGLGHSLKIAGLAAVLSASIGFLVAYVLVFTNYKFKNLIQTCSILSLAVPGVVLGIGYIFVWNQRWLESFNLALYGTPAILVLAGVAGAIPFAVRLQLGAFSKIPQNMLSAAAMQGAHAGHRMKDIVAPLVRSSLLIAGLAAFGSSIFDLAITSILYPPNYPMLPVAINKGFEQLRYGYSTASTILSGALVVGIILVVDLIFKTIFKYMDRRKEKPYV